MNQDPRTIAPTDPHPRTVEPSHFRALEPSHPRTVLITGASSGIGAAFADVFAAHGFDVVIAARREDRLREVAVRLEGATGRRVHVVACDLSRRQAPADLCQEIASRGITIDALVNNAGYGVPGTYAASPWERHEAMLNLMVMAVSELTYRLLPGMIELRPHHQCRIAGGSGAGARGTHALCGDQGVCDQVLRSPDARGPTTQVCDRGMPRLHAKRIPRRDRDTRSGQQAPGVDVDGRAHVTPGFRCRDAGHAHLHQRTRKPRD